MGEDLVSKFAANEGTRRIVIAGGGFAGAYTFKRLHEHFHANPLIKLILVNRTNYFLFTPLLHEVATGGVSAENTVEPLRKVLGCCMAQFQLGQVKGVSLRRKILRTSLGEIAYDYLVLALGSETNYHNVPGAKEYALTLKSLSDAVRLKKRIIRAFEQASASKDLAGQRELLNFVVIGGGPTGVELAAEIAEFCLQTFRVYYPRGLSNSVQVWLIHKGAQLLPHFPSRIRARSKRALEEKQVKVYLRQSVNRVTPRGVFLSGNGWIPTRTPIWVAGIKPTSIKFDLPLLRGQDGSLVVNSYLQLSGQKNVFALGDLAWVVDEAYVGKVVPHTAQAATHQARVVADNIGHLVRQEPLEEYHYQHRGDLISLGRWKAAAEVGRFSLVGHLAWWLYRFVYLSYLLSWPKKIQVATDWLINLLTPRDIAEV